MTAVGADGRATAALSDLASRAPQPCAARLRSSTRTLRLRGQGQECAVQRRGRRHRRELDRHHQHGRRRCDRHHPLARSARPTAPRSTRPASGQRDDLQSPRRNRPFGPLAPRRRRHGRRPHRAAARHVEPPAASATPGRSPDESSTAARPPTAAACTPTPVFPTTRFA